MKISLGRILQIISILIVGAIIWMILPFFVNGLEVNTFTAGILATIIIIPIQGLIWYIFVEFLSRLPYLLYPIVTFVLSGVGIYVLALIIPDIEVDGLMPAIWTAFWYTLIQGIVGAILALNQGGQFDRSVTKRLIKKTGQITKSDQPGFIFIEIDGLSEDVFKEALEKGFMPHLKKWVDNGTYEITGWETDFTSQTGSMQPGILLGNNDEVPAFRWWDREKKRMIMSGNPRDSLEVETFLSNGNGLLSEGGASRGNMYSGDATESLFTMSTVLKKGNVRGPGIYSYLLHPYVIARLISKMLVEIVKEWVQAWQQRRRKDPYRVSARNPGYALLRAFMSPFMQEIATYTIIGDMLRGVPAVYALYAGYDDLSHFAGMQSPDAFSALTEIDEYFARFEFALKEAPRPYHVIVLSDHGQTMGFRFDTTFNVSLSKLVESLIKEEGEVYLAQGTDETFQKMQALLTQSINEDTRTAKILKTALRSRTNQDGLVEVSNDSEDSKKAAEKSVVAFCSGCAGLIYNTQKDHRMTYEEIQAAYPELIPGLVSHPGIGFVLVKSSEQGDMVIGKDGFYFLDDDKVEGENPLAVFSPNAPLLLRRETGFKNAPDVLVHSVYDPEKEEAYNFENQVSHHGGLGGPQNRGIVFHPKSLSAPDEPIITAVGLYTVLKGWRDKAQTN